MSTPCIKTATSNCEPSDQTDLRVKPAWKKPTQEAIRESLRERAPLSGEYIQIYRSPIRDVLTRDLETLTTRWSLPILHEEFCLLYRETDQAAHQLAHAKTPAERRVAQFSFEAKLKRSEASGKDLGIDSKNLSKHFYQKANAYRNDPANLPFPDPNGHEEWETQKKIVAATFGYTDELQRIERFLGKLKDISVIFQVNPKDPKLKATLEELRLGRDLKTE